MSLPSAAAAPVSGARRPILMGPPCAGAVRGAASDAASATLRTAASVRTWMRVIGGAPLHRLASDGGDPTAAPPRPRPPRVRGPHEAVVVRPEDAGKRGEEARDHEGEVLVEPHIVAERPHARLALADALEPEPERRAYEHAHRPPGERRRPEREVEER